MTQPDRAAKLYTPRLLALSTQLSDYPLRDELPYKADLRARTCGSTITVVLDLGEGGAVTRIGMQVAACAVGQSSAAIMAGGISGRTHGEIDGALAAIERWLSDEGALPDWPDFDALSGAREHAGRRDALLLPWRAALKALSMVPSNG